MNADCDSHTTFIETLLVGGTLQKVVKCASIYQCKRFRRRAEASAFAFFTNGPVFVCIAFDIHHCTSTMLSSHLSQFLLFPSQCPTSHMSALIFTSFIPSTTPALIFIFSSSLNAYRKPIIGNSFLYLYAFVFLVVSCLRNITVANSERNTDSYFHFNLSIHCSMNHF
ncbi:hypothetical protein AB6A40_007100 [Gnathostoma spinigerum]|uniref:Uncharacterized protein n=1 Tax=Gnathostoma spinigerum TaxID=75299 RepID=A0ABD6EKU5_9BILA